MTVPSAPFSFVSSLKFPANTGQPEETIGINFVGQHGPRSEQVLILTGSGTHVLSFGTVASPGAKLLLVMVDSDISAQPVNLRFNSGSAGGQAEVSPGGFLVIGSPNPVSGITSLSIVYASNVVVRVWILG